MNKNIIIFHTKSYKYLADEVFTIVKNECVNFGNDHGIYPGEIITEEFPDGEIYHRITSNVSGADIYLIGGTISDQETLELFDLGTALVKQGANSLTMIIPYFGYSTMERAVKPGEIVKAKTRAELLSHIDHGSIRNRIFFIDLHSEGIPHYFEGSVQTTHLYAKEIITEICEEEIQENSDDSFVLGSTDAGRAKWIESLSKDMGVDCAIIIKRRVSGSETQITGISASVENRIVIIYDDMIRTGGSLIKAAKAYKEAGATKVFAIATHGVLPNDSVKELEDCGYLEAVYVTNTHPSAMKETYNKKFLHVKSIAPLIFDTVFSGGRFIAKSIG